MTTTGTLSRNTNDRWIAGVCGGIARWLGWDAGLVRLLYLIISICSAAFPGILVYIILWLVMPADDEI
jgi:phage shock protein C